MPRQKRGIRCTKVNTHPTLPVWGLIVDDSVVVRKLLCEALATRAEVKVAGGGASSGAIALAKIPHRFLEVCIQETHK